MITIILIEPEFETNIGAIARTIKNFEINNLIIINPKTQISEHAFIVAKHAKDILENAKIINEYDLSILKQFDTVVAMTAKTSSKYNINRNALYVDEFVKKIKQTQDNNTAIIFGREGDGLFNNEIDMCDYTITIPSSKEYRTLNLSHSVSIFCYEYFKHKNQKKKYKTLPKKEKESMYELLKKITSTLNYNPGKRTTAIKVFRRIMEKAMPSIKESTTMMGLFRKIEEKTNK